MSAEPPGTVGIKPARPPKPAAKPKVDREQRPVEEHAPSSPSSVNVSASTVRGLLRARRVRTSPTNYRKSRTAKTDVKPVAVEPIKMFKVLAPERRSNDVPDAGVSVARLLRTLALEVAALRHAASLTDEERRAYLRCHPTSRAVR